MGSSKNSSHDNRDFYSDDPDFVELPNRRKNISSLLALVMLVVGGGFFLQTTLASNLRINSGASVEFGQGSTQVITCAASPANVIFTPRSTFTNVSGAGSHKFSSLTVSGIPDGCWGEDLTINAYATSDSTPLTIFNSTSTDAVIYDNAGTFEVGIGGAGMTITSAPNAFTITFTSPVASSATVFKLTIQIGAHAVTPSTCAEGGSCIPGNRGPGGGIVFYAAAADFTSAGSTCNTTCKYLEAAPSTWKSGSFADDLTYVWSNNMSTLTGQNISTPSTEGIAAQSASEKYNWKIGQGFYNTNVMRVAGALSTAQAAVLAYAATDSSAGQWFLPSANELNELCKYARNQTTGNPHVACTNTLTLRTGTSNDLGGFVAGNYWSSTEFVTGYAIAQTLLNAVQLWDTKDNIFYVRPVRAF